MQLLSLAYLLITLLIFTLGCSSEHESDSPPSNPAQPIERSPFDDRLEAIHSKWMGTPWAFSGTSQKPGEGSIACGYFVTTTLQQAGMKVARVRLAQAASETMILELTEPHSVRRYSDTELEQFLASTREQGMGYYIVGLDNHTGFLRVASDGHIAFIHSGPGRGVVAEDPRVAPELASSRYRVTGKISDPWNSEEIEPRIDAD